MKSSEAPKKAPYVSAFNILAPLVLAAAFVFIERSTLFEKFENLTLDQRIKIRYTHQEPIDSRIFLIAIDDISIEQLGRWPFDRSTHAQFMGYLSLGKPAVYSWDIIFDSYNGRNNTLSESSQQFANICASLNTPVITGTVATNLDRTHTPVEAMASLGWNPGTKVINSDIANTSYLIAPIPEIAEHSKIGIVNADRHHDGIVRKIQFVVRGGLKVFPSLSLASIIELWKLDPEKDISIVLGDAVYIDSPLVKRRIPIDEKGFYTINYRYEIADLNSAGTAAPYSLIMARYQNKYEHQQKNVALPEINGKVLVIGQTAPGQTDIGRSPLSGLSPLVLTHINILDNILKEDYIVTIPRWVEWLLFIIISYVTFIFPIHMDFWIKILIPIATVFLYTGLAVILFSTASLNLPVLAPCLAFLFLHTVGIGREVFTERRAREELRNTFSAYVAPGILNSIHTNPDALKLGGAKKDVAILFTDIRSFTSMTEVMDSEVLVAQLNEYFTDMVDGINSNGGTLHKFIGDAIMAVWGDITNHTPNMDAGRALHASLDMRKALCRLNRNWINRNRREFKMGIGINFGQVTVGNIGAPQRMEFTVIGDSVNLAARLESLNKKFGTEILVGESMYSLTMERFRFRSIAKVQVIGKQKSVQIYEVLCEKGKEADSPYDMRWVHLYEEGYSRFMERRFDVAVRIFEGCLHDRPEDKASKLLLQTSREFQKNTPKKDWNGTFEITSK